MDVIVKLAGRVVKICTFNRDIFSKCKMFRKEKKSKKKVHQVVQTKNPNAVLDLQWTYG